MSDTAVDSLAPVEAGEQVNNAGVEIRTFWSDGWRILRHRWQFWFAGAIIGLFTLMAVVPDLFTFFGPAPSDPDGLNCPLGDSRLSPGADHWFGTNTQGCDYFVQVIHGAKVSMRVAIGTTLVTVVIGVLLGGISGYAGGWIDNVITRIADGFFALPWLVGAIIVLSVLASTGQRNEWHIVMAMAFLNWPATLRVFRSTVLQTKNMEYVHAARALGASDSRILLRHITPNALAPALISATMGMGVIISLEATLSFLGIGLPLGTISWGIMLDEAQQAAMAGRDLHLIIFPSIFLILASLSFVLMGEELREAFDPRLR